MNLIKGRPRFPLSRITAADILLWYTKFIFSRDTKEEHRGLDFLELPGKLLGITTECAGARGIASCCCFRVLFRMSIFQYRCKIALHFCKQNDNWLSWPSIPEDCFHYRTRAGREVDFVLHAPHCLLAIEARASGRAHREDARPLVDLLGKPHPPGIARDAWRLGLIVTRGREVELLAPHVWAIPDWRLFGPSD